MIIFAGHLPESATRDDVQACFEQWGAIKAVRIPQTQDGHHRGIAFVEMTHDRDAMLAIQELNGRDWDGRNIHVSQARPRTQQTR